MQVGAGCSDVLAEFIDVVGLPASLRIRSFIYLCYFQEVAALDSSQSRRKRVAVAASPTAQRAVRVSNSECEQPLRSCCCELDSELKGTWVCTYELNPGAYNRCIFEPANGDGVVTYPG
eukprot:GHVU01101230.1.p1 GENE.GHVU01101230.1~~GHVU01101230.1.p1  ORF type:complete len:119 (+),score=3.12 GHVU01101230.1:179-535(+)